MRPSFDEPQFDEPQFDEPQFGEPSDPLKLRPRLAGLSTVRIASLATA